MNDKVIVLRAGGYGDHIIWSSVLPVLLDRYEEVSLELCPRGVQLFYNDPRIASVYQLDPSIWPEDIRWERLKERWDKMDEIYPGHDVANFHYTFENACVTYEWHDDARLPIEERIAKYGQYNPHEMVFKTIGEDIPEGWKRTSNLFFTQDEEDCVLRWRKRNEDYFVMLLSLGGSGVAKVFPTWMEDFCRRAISGLSKLKIYILGDDECRKESWECERTETIAARIGFRQALHMTKYADFVLGPDTGILAGAGMFGTPKTALCTIYDKNRLFRYDENDFSLQSKSECSPCYVLAHTGFNCEKEPFYNAFPICTHEWDQDEIFSLIEAQYRRKF